MKRYMRLLGVLMIGSGCALQGAEPSETAAIAEKQELLKLVKAIDKLDVEETSRLVKEQGPLVVTKKQGILKVVQAKVDECKNKTKSLIRSEEDLLRVICGSLAVLIAFKATLRGISGAQRLRNVPLVLALGGGVGGFCAYQVLKGWQLDYAYKCLEKAMAIEKLVHDA
jgi:hypothetical protein